MTKPAKKTAKENLDEMLNRIRSENEALKRLITALVSKNTEICRKLKTNKS